MGGERSSTTRQREHGKICFACHRSIDRLPWTGKETYCDRCAEQRSTHKVYMFFMLRGGWRCQFLEPDLKTPLPKKLTFAGPEKVQEMWSKFGLNKMSEDRSALEHAIANGRGGIWLTLTRDQYIRLKGGK